jgi:hypothetical protein
VGPVSAFLPLLSWPAVLWGAAVAVPALVAIYLLRDRFQSLPVSALFLWRSAALAHRGGRRRHRPILPPPFFLELLVLLLLILAAAGPRWRSGSDAPPLVVVLDDSFSMLAGAPDSPRQRGEAALRRLVAEGRYGRIHLVLAGAEPRLLAATEGEGEALEAALQQWRGGSPAAALTAAVSLAQQVTAGAPGAGDPRRIVLTDGPPPEDLAPEGSGIEWWAFGTPAANLALVNAARGERGCLFEVANLGNTTAEAELTVDVAEGRRSSHPLALAPGEVGRLRLPLAEDAGAVFARLPADGLAVDNAAVLLPEVPPSVAVAVAVRDPERWRPLTAALESSGIARRSRPGDPAVELLFTDAPEAWPDPGAGAGRWVVELRSPEPAAAYLGPFIADRRHPLMEGVELAGVIWAAGPEGETPGVPLLSAGNVPLVVAAERQGRPWLTLYLHPELSTVVRAPAWPALVWNLLRWRSGEALGVSPVNGRLGSAPRLVVPGGRAGAPGEPSALVTEPDGTSREVPLSAREVRLEVEAPGLYRVAVEGRDLAFAVNALDAGESDLRGRATGRWGRWQPGTEAGAWRYREVAWIPLLVALGLLLLHLRFFLAAESEVA